MDDPKLYERNNNDLKWILEMLKDSNDDIGIKFGLDKCDKAKFKAGEFS